MLPRCPNSALSAIPVARHGLCLIFEPATNIRHKPCLATGIAERAEFGHRGNIHYPGRKIFIKKGCLPHTPPDYSMISSMSSLCNDLASGVRPVPDPVANA